MKILIKSNAFEWLKVLPLFSSEKQILIFAMVLILIPDRYGNAISHQAKYIVEACMPK
jgi:hypothetical protein